MKVCDLVYLRIGGSDDYPELRPGFVTRNWGDGCFNVRVLLDPDDWQHEGIAPRDIELGQRVYIRALRGERVGMFWTDADRGKAPEHRYTLNQSKPKT